MSATFLDSEAEGRSALIHRVVVDRPLKGLELIDSDDPVSRLIFEWINDPSNGAEGQHGMLNFQMVEGKGGYYTWGFSDAITAARFRATFPFCDAPVVA
jgi:hypothetical protein